ncbi:MAG: hypothetical protein BGO67_06335 [Alphaproteobacteria bacterium 41-28]|nr:MAG: hypothetical protein BGO67_06335 [Alphaproteobacteria bacterium 41-28]
MEKRTALLAFLFTNIISAGALQARDVTITYTGPALGNNIPKDTTGTLFMGVFANSTIDVHNPITNEHQAFTYTYKPTATTIGPVLFGVAPEKQEVNLKPCRSSTNEGKIPVTVEGLGGKQKTLKKVIVHLNSSKKQGSDKDTVFFTNSCSVEEIYE